MREFASETPKQQRDIGSAVIASAMEDLRTRPVHDEDFQSAAKFLFPIDKAGVDHLENMCLMSNVSRAAVGLEQRNYRMHFDRLPFLSKMEPIGKAGQQRKTA